MAHTKFYAPAARDDPRRPTHTVCHSCVALLDVPVEPIAAILERLRPSWPQRGLS